jgi:putative transport protein
MNQSWLGLWWAVDSPARTFLVVCLVVVLGLELGRLRVRGLGLGVAGVLFAGLLFGHLGVSANSAVLEFLREFGLVLFVYGIGMQVGPGFFDSLRKQGLVLNALAAAIVGLGVLLTILLALKFKIPAGAAAGLFSGATTNTPSLAAGQEALRDILSGDGVARSAASQMAGQSYAVAYPFGVIGIIIAMLLVRRVFDVNVQGEVETLEHENHPQSLATRNLKVSNPNLEGVALSEVPTISDSKVTVSRILRADEVQVAAPQTTLREGDVLLGVGTPQGLDQLQIVVGEKSDVDVRSLPAALVSRRIVVTRDRVIGKTLHELGLWARDDASFTRVWRMELELTPDPRFHLQFGDRLRVVGSEKAVAAVARMLGDAPKELDQTRLGPLFIGLALGVLLGIVPLPAPGLPGGVKLGIAAGPLLVAMLLARLRRVGPFVFYLPQSANSLLREFGIALFLACAGLKAGGGFWNALASGQGLVWMACGALVTLLPLLLVSGFARWKLRLPFPVMCGLMAGSATDPPALAFAGSLNNSQTPSLTYATVYPLVMILRVVAAQIIVLILTAAK